MSVIHFDVNELANVAYLIAEEHHDNWLHFAVSEPNEARARLEKYGLMASLVAVAGANARAWNVRYDGEDRAKPWTAQEITDATMRIPPFQWGGVQRMGALATIRMLRYNCVEAEPLTLEESEGLGHLASSGLSIAMRMLKDS